MNRSYTQSQEIDCSCFDFRRRDFSFSQYSANTFKPFIDARRQKNGCIGLPNPAMQEKSHIKKSLKRKYLNQSMKQTNYKTYKDNQIADKQQPRANQPRSQNKENEPKEQLQQIHIFQLSQYKQKNSGKIQKQSKLNQRRNKNGIKKIEQICEKKKNIPIKQFSIQHNQEETSTTVVKQKKKSLKTFEPSDAQSQSKTIKKRASLFKDHNFMNSPNETYKYFEEKSQVHKETAESWNKHNYNNYKGESIRNFARKLKNVYPKQIQSFQSQQLSADQSQVIERGRFTWAPEGTEKPGQVQFISSLHIKEASRRSKMVESSRNRI